MNTSNDGGTLVLTTVKNTQTYLIVVDGKNGQKGIGLMFSVGPIANEWDMDERSDAPKLQPAHFSGGRLVAAQLLLSAVVLTLLVWDSNPQLLLATIQRCSIPLLLVALVLKTFTLGLHEFRLWLVTNRPRPSIL